MAATDGQIIVAAARWADDATYLRDFVGKYRLPAVIKITKGQYGGLGVPTLPAPGLQSTALLVSAGRRRKIVAQAVKIKEGRRVVGVGPRLAIPDSYVGYFEILSEEGRAVRGIESVGELARRCPEEGALVREAVRGVACRVEESGAVVPEGSRTLPAGETISVVGEVTLPNRVRFLRCLDCRGDTVLLAMDQRARFSALAREDNISGVHTARALLSKRLPLTVRLVHGQPPRGLKSSSQFLPELRLLSSFEEEHVFALPLQREGAAVALPLAAPLKLVKARNEEALRAMPELARLVERASRLVVDVADRAHVLDGRLGESKPSRQVRGGGFLRRSASSDSANVGGHHRHHHHHHYHHQHSAPGHGHGYRDENRVPTAAYTEDYDEIDQIYDYVRGFAPLPKSVRSPYESAPLGNQQSNGLLIVPEKNGPKDRPDAAADAGHGDDRPAARRQTRAPAHRDDTHEEEPGGEAYAALGQGGPEPPPPPPPSPPRDDDARDDDAAAAGDDDDGDDDDDDHNGAPGVAAGRAAGEAAPGQALREEQRHAAGPAAHEAEERLAPQGDAAWLQGRLAHLQHTLQEPHEPAAGDGARWDPRLEPLGRQDLGRFGRRRQAAGEEIAATEQTALPDEPRLGVAQRERHRWMRQAGNAADDAGGPPALDQVRAPARGHRRRPQARRNALPLTHSTRRRSPSAAEGARLWHRSPMYTVTNQKKKKKKRKRKQEKDFAPAPENHTRRLLCRRREGVKGRREACAQSSHPSSSATEASRRPPASLDLGLPIFVISINLYYVISCIRLRVPFLTPAPRGPNCFIYFRLRVSSLESCIEANEFCGGAPPLPDRPRQPTRGRVSETRVRAVREIARFRRIIYIYIYIYIYAPRKLNE